jgi:NADH:ubiquinone oxidoreductase subunit 5 (subunit L)/multisubunit Na+/H+ antiporter MnhA subunit
LVTAGVYPLIRFSPSFSYWLNFILLLISGLTIFMVGVGANFEFDLKKIIALPTLSQLGLMIVTISVGLSGLALRLYYLCVLVVLWVLWGILRIFVLWVVYLFICLLPLPVWLN